METRAGRFVQQQEGYRAFLPNDLPPTPPIEINGDLLLLLSEANRTIGKLNGIGEILPDPDFFLAMFVREEAVLSSQIEGTQCSLTDVLNYEIDPKGVEKPQDVKEVVNYVRAMNYGLKRLSDLPLSLRLIREIHAELMKGARGAERSPGEFRRTQNWIGQQGCTLTTATFVPPPVHEMTKSLGQLEKFMHEGHQLPALINASLIHAQFETIHPFLDGNGRMGRLLITFFLCVEKILTRPLLYLSLYFKQNRSEYYERLMDVRKKGDWEGWIQFFLQGVNIVGDSACKKAIAVYELREDVRRKVAEKSRSTSYALQLADLLFKQPLVTARYVEQKLGCAFATVGNLIEDFSKLKLLEETTGGHRNRLYRFTPYLKLFDV